MRTLSLIRRFCGRSQDVPSAEMVESLCRIEVYRYALRRLSCPQDAEDIAAEVYVVARETHWRQGMEARPWLLGIARRKVADRLRKRLRHPETGLLEAHEALVTAQSPEESLLREEAVRKIRELVLALPELQREALLLQSAEGLSVQEIAQVMKRSPSAVNSLLGRARETIRRRGSDYFEDKNR